MKTHLLRRYSGALVGGRKQIEYLRTLGFPKDQIFAGYDVVDNKYFSYGSKIAKTDAAKLRDNLQLPPCYFLACTRFLRRKNLDGLLRAYAYYRVRSKNAPWSLVIVGDGEESQTLRRLESELGLKGVSWPGFVQYDLLPSYYGLAMAFIHPAKSEPWGLVINEAAASSLPLLVSDTVGARYELVRDRGNGFLFDPNDVDDICRALLDTSTMSSKKLKEMGQLSFEIINDWTPLTFGKQLFAAIRET